MWNIVILLMSILHNLYFITMKDIDMINNIIWKNLIEVISHDFRGKPISYLVVPRPLAHQAEVALGIHAYRYGNQEHEEDGHGQHGHYDGGRAHSRVIGRPAPHARPPTRVALVGLGACRSARDERGVCVWVGMGEIYVIKRIRPALKIFQLD